MTVLNSQLSDPDENNPGIERHLHVSGELGDSESLFVTSLTFADEGRVRTHIHPTEEAMVVLEGELEAILGDETVKVVSGQTVHAPAGVKHGFVNRSGATARIMAIFPTSTVEKEWED